MYSCSLPLTDFLLYRPNGDAYALVKTFFSDLHFFVLSLSQTNAVKEHW